jgi:hypothetical protein
MSRYKGSCHCKNITFEFDADTISDGLRCNCSICRRKGTVMSSFVLAGDELDIEAGSEDLGVYEFGTGVAKHFFCKNCGIYTFHETLRVPGKFRVNLGCVDEVDVFDLKVDVFDGKAL